MVESVGAGAYAGRLKGGNRVIKDKAITHNSLFTYTVLGRLVDFDDNRVPIVEIVNGKSVERHPARSCIKLTSRRLGDKVVLVIAENEAMPIITGVIESEPVEVELENQSSITESVIKLDGNVLKLKAAESISLECGQAKITLTKDGKIKIKGKYLLSRAKKANRIQGGSVELN